MLSQRDQDIIDSLLKDGEIARLSRPLPEPEEDFNLHSQMKADKARRREILKTMPLYSRVLWYGLVVPFGTSFIWATQLVVLYGLYMIASS